MLGINKNTIKIDSDGYWMFGSDQVYDSFPIRFPTVTIALESTGTLDRLADAKRMKAGYLPMFPVNRQEVYDEDGWYNFYIGLNGVSDSRVDSCIEAVVQSPSADDDEQIYCIDLTEAEQIEIYNVLDGQLRERFNTSCAELLEEARLEMEI